MINLSSRCLSRYLDFHDAILQEPGVYMVFMTAILQDASISVKLASNMMEREVWLLDNNQSRRFNLKSCRLCRWGPAMAW